MMIGNNIWQLKTIFDWYFANRNIILILVNMIFIGVSIILAYKIYKKEKKIEYIYTYMKSLLDVSLIALVGVCLMAVGLKLNFPIDYFPMLLFTLISIFILAVEIYVYIKYYRSIYKIMSQEVKIFVPIILGIILLLSIMERLELIEFISAILGIIFLKTSSRYFDVVYKIKYQTPKEIRQLKNDYPIVKEEDLFATRKRQLNRFCKDLEETGKDPFVFMISGEWGSGKTSFINVFKSKLSRAEFVNVECSLSCDLNGILSEISEQIQTIFIDNKMYLGKNNIINQYFEKLNEIINAAGYKSAAKFLKIIKLDEENIYEKRKEQINQELNAFYNQTKKVIYIIVDNMDRIIDEKMKTMIFQVIYESVGLENCVILFMADYKKLMNKELDKEFIEKYVNRKIELCNVGLDEIIYKLQGIFLTQSFWSDRGVYIREKWEVEQHKIWTNIFNITNNIKNEIEKREMKMSENKDNILKKYLEILEDANYRLSIRTRNPRKVKRFLYEIEKNLSIADIVWFQEEGFEENEYTEADWIKIIFQVAYLKSFLVEEYEALLSAGNLETFKNSYEKESYIIDYILDDFSPLISNSNTVEVYGYVIYRLYALDIETTKSKHQKLIEEIEEGNLIDNHLENYINECLGVNFNYQRMKKILNYIDTHNFESTQRKSQVILELVKIISNTAYLGAAGYLDILKSTHKMVMDLKNVLSERDLNGLKHGINIFRTRLVFGNQSILLSLLAVYYKIDTTQYSEKAIDSVEKLYLLISEIHFNCIKKELTIEGSKYSTLKKYFQNLERTFKNNDYLYAREELLYFYEKVKLMYEALEVWQDFDEELEKVESGNRLIEDLNFNDVNQIMHVLNVINSKMGNNEMIECFIEFLYRIEKELNDNPHYMHDNIEQIANKLCSMYEEIPKANPQVLEMYGDRWKYCRIRLFKLRRLAGIK